MRAILCVCFSVMGGAHNKENVPPHSHSTQRRALEQRAAALEQRPAALEQRPAALQQRPAVRAPPGMPRVFGRPVNWAH